MDKHTKEMEEVSQIVGVRTRAMTSAMAAVDKSTKKRKTAAGIPVAEYQILQLRSRNLVRIPRSRDNRYSSSVRNRHKRSISASESNASCEFPAGSRRSSHQEIGGNSGSAVQFSSLENQRIIRTIPLNHDTESTAGIPSPTEKSPPVTFQFDAEIDEFLAEAERKEVKRFANKYNFDVVKEKPLEGRYKWIKI